MTEITLTIDRFIELVDMEAELQALKSLGVNKWEKYDKALELKEKMIGEQEENY